MRQIATLIMRVAYFLGVVAVLAALVVVFIPTIPNPIHVTSRGCLVFAATLFWCAIASHLVARHGE